MATGGASLLSSRVDGSDFVFDYVCSLCELDGKEIEATGWCQNCQDYLCAGCYAHHLLPKPSRDHVLLDKNQMPKSIPCDLCSRGGKKVDAAGYCTDCDDYLCTTCFDNHLKPKPSRNHTLLDKKRMPLDRQQPRKTKAQHVRDIDVANRAIDMKKPNITGSVILPGNKLVLVDNWNHQVKLIDLNNNNLQSIIQLPLIWDISRISNTQVAVTNYGKETIDFLNVSYELKLDKSIKVRGQCGGIACLNDKLVVCFTDPVKIEIISMDGQVLQNVVSEHKGKHLFTMPWYVEVSRDQTSIYISDWQRNTVTNLTLTGDVASTFQSGDLEYPKGLAIDKTGAVYVFGASSNNLVQLSAKLTQPRLLLQGSDGVALPTSACICENTDTLYIGMFESCVKVFQLS